MKKFNALVLATVITGILFATPQIAAAAEGVVAGKTLYSASGKRVGAIYRVTEEGNVMIILNGKMVTIPAASISVADGKIKAAAERRDLLASS